MTRIKYSSWWLLLFAGTILILIGVSGFIKPWSTFLYLVKYLGFALLLSSIFLFVHALSTKTLKAERKWLMLEGLADLTLASLLIFNPFLAIIAFPLLIGSWIILRGVIKILHYTFISRAVFGSGSILVVGIISLFSGILIMLLPTDKTQGVSNAFCILALLSGGLYIFDAIRYRKFERTIVALL